MDLFFNLGISGLMLIILGALSIRNPNNKPEDKYSNKFKILNIYTSYLESYILAKINLVHGVLLLITGVLGLLFYDTLGLAMVFIMVLVISSYLLNLFINGYKYYKQLY